MSETAAAVEAPEVAESVVEAPEAPAAVEPEQTGSTKPKEGLADIPGNAKKRLMAKYEALTQGKEQPRVPAGTTEGGQFAADETTEKQETTDSTETVTEVVADSPPESSASEEVVSEVDTADATSEAITPPAESVTVRLADDHPLRQRGREAFTVSPEDERDLRALLNSHTRRSELDSVNQQLSDMGTQLAESRAQTDYWQDRASTGGVLDTDQQARYQDILKTYGDADANAYRQGIISQSGTEGLEARTAEALQTHQQTVAGQRADKFANSAISDALRGNPQAGVDAQYPHWTEHEVRQALSGYGSICDARSEQPTPSGWYAYANVVYAQNPQAQAAQTAKTEQDRERIAAEAKATATAEAKQREESNLKDAATRHATRPGSIPSVATAGVRDPGTTDEKAALKKLSPSQQKRARGKLIRNWAQRAQT